jgi:hypothetical protein
MMQRYLMIKDIFMQAGVPFNRVAAFMLVFLTATTIFAQKEDGSKTIDITSSFKPSLVPPKKIIPNASPATANAVKPSLTYNIPAQQLKFRYTPAPLKPLAYKDTSRPVEDRGYVKAGYGNFATPYIRAALNFGNGTVSNGNVEGHYTSSKGKLPYQQFSRYGIKANGIFQLDENHSLQARAGFSGQNLYRYGYKPDTLVIPEDSLKLNYNNIHLGATLGNRKANNLGVYYKAVLDGHFFSDNHNGNETALHYDLPLEKILNEKVTFEVGIKGVLHKLNTDDTSFSNNLTMVRAGASFTVKENLKVKLALMPSWSSGNFNLLPVIEVESYMPDKDLVLQAGVTGSYIENTWRSLTAFNPWIVQPTQLNHARNIEFFGAVKGTLSENWFYRIKGSFNRRYNQALYVNDSIDGRTFLVRWEPSMNIVTGLAELVWQQGDKYTWTNTLVMNGYSGLKQSSKAYGLLPFEITSTFRGKILDKLTGKVDLYNFGQAWRLGNGKPDKGEGGVDLNLGAEFEVYKNVKLWLQFNNLFNNEYQRWNQYPVLGFQAIGGVIFKF